MTCTSIGAPIAHAFNPSDWLRKFEAVGGAYTVDETTLNLIIPVFGNTYALAARARRMIDSLADQQQEAVRAHLSALQASKLGEANHG